MKLQTKLLLFLACLALGSGGAILVLSGDAVKDVLTDAAAQRGLVELDAAAGNAQGGMIARSEKLLLPLLQAARKQTGASYAAAVDPSGVVVAHTNVLEKGKVYGDAATRKSLTFDRPAYQVVSVEGGVMIDAAAPVWAPEEDFVLSHEKAGKTRLGVIRLGLPMDQALATEKTILRRIAAILAATVAFNLLLFVLISRRVLGPVRRLAEAAARIGRGQYGFSIPGESQDELGELTRSFNKMNSALAATTVSKDYLDGIFQSIADMLIVTDPQGRVQTLNPAARSLLGYGAAEAAELAAGALFESRRSVFDVIALAGSAKDIELDMVGKSGRKIPVLLSGSVLKGRDGGREGFVLVAKDLRERKKLERALVQSEKLSAVGQLAAGVAHEINNPLGIILGFAQSAARRIKDADPLWLPIRSIEREAQRCKALVQSLLTFSRQGKAEKEPVDISETVGDTLAIIEAQARVRSVELVSELEATEPVLADRNQIQQIVVNLCNNAIDAMPGGGRIVVRTKTRAGWIVLEIEDNGSGIAEEIKDKIFDPFFTTKEVGKGTGLGLALVYEIVKGHEGEIEVDSEVGRGTVFKILLPARKVRETLDAGDGNAK